MAFHGKISFSDSDEMPYFERKAILEQLLPKMMKEEAKYQNDRDNGMVRAIGSIVGMARIM